MESPQEMVSKKERKLFLTVAAGRNGIIIISLILHPFFYSRKKTVSRLLFK